MPQLLNYSTSSAAYVWTGLNNQNQAWSYFYVPEPIIVTSIEAYWGGYGTSTTGKHAIWKWTSGNGAQLAGLVVASGTISVTDGRAWRTASVTETFLDAGHYSVGVWADPSKSRIFGQYNSNDATTLYLETADTLETGSTADATDGSGVLPCRINYEYAGRIGLNVSGSWKKGQVWINNGGWKRSKGVFINNSGWKRSK